MDDNNLHNDFDDSEIRTPDKYDEFGYRRMSKPSSNDDDDELQGVPLSPKTKMLLFIIVLILILIGPRLINFISIFNNNTSKENKPDYTVCLEKVNKYIQDKYELKLDYTSVTDDKLNNLCHVTYKYNESSFDVYYDNFSNDIYDNKNANDIKANFNNLVESELSSNSKTIFKFRKYNVSDDLFKYNIDENNYYKVFESYDIFVFSFDSINALKMTEFLNKYHINNLRIINIDSKYKDEIEDFNDINNVMNYVDNFYIFLNSIKNITLKHITIDKDYINDFIKEKSTDNIYLNIELLKNSDNKEYDVNKENNCINYTFNENANILNVYYYSKNTDSIKVKFDDRYSYIINKSNKEYYHTSNESNSLTICINK